MTSFPDPKQIPQTKPKKCPECDTELVLEPKGPPILWNKRVCPKCGKVVYI